MKRKHRITNVLGLGSLPLIKRDYISQPRFGLKKFQAEESAREQELKDAPLCVKQATAAALKQVLAEEVQEFFSQPIDLLNSGKPSQVPVDLDVSGTPATEPITVEQYRATQIAFWEKNLKPRGIELSESGWIRFNIYVGTICGRGLAVTSDLLESAFQRLIDLDCFNAGEITGTLPPKTVRPKPPVAAQPEPSIEHLSTENKEQRAEILRITGKGWSADFTQWFMAWTDSLRQNFNYEFPVAELGEKAASFLERHNLSPFVHASWNKIRVAFVKLGYFPDTMLTPSEQLAALVEDSDFSDREVRLAFNRKQREINEAAQRLGGMS